MTILSNPKELSTKLLYLTITIRENSRWPFKALCKSSSTSNKRITTKESITVNSSRTRASPQQTASEPRMRHLTLIQVSTPSIHTPVSGNRNLVQLACQMLTTKVRKLMISPHSTIRLCLARQRARPPLAMASKESRECSVRMIYKPKVKSR